VIFPNFAHRHRQFLPHHVREFGKAGPEFLILLILTIRKVRSKKQQLAG
jgi:hypothetical protein